MFWEIDFYHTVRAFQVSPHFLSEGILANFSNVSAIDYVAFALAEEC